MTFEEAKKAIEATAGMINLMKRIAPSVYDDTNNLIIEVFDDFLKAAPLAVEALDAMSIEIKDNSEGGL